MITRGLANKFLHAPLQALRAAAQDGDDERLSVLRDTFHLDDAPPTPQTQAENAPEPGETAVQAADPAAIPVERS